MAKTLMIILTVWVLLFKCAKCAHAATHIQPLIHKCTNSSTHSKVTYMQLTLGGRVAARGSQRFDE